MKPFAESKQPKYLPTIEEIETICKALRENWCRARRERAERPAQLPRFSESELLQSDTLRRARE